MKKKAIIYGLCLSLAFSLVGCGGQQAQEPQEPEQDIQQVKQVTTDDKAENTDNEQQELSGDTLISYFELAYEGSSSYTSGMETEESIQFELEVIRARVFYDNVRLPYDYEVQYREWRPKDTPPAIEESSKQEVTDQQQEVEQQKTEQQSEPKVNTNTQVTQTPVESTPPPVSSGSGQDRYDGYSTYSEYIDSIQREFPDIPRSELERKFPDTANSQLDEESYYKDIASDPFNHHN